MHAEEGVVSATTGDVVVELRDVQNYTFRSQDNTFRPDKEFVLGEARHVTSRHAVTCRRGEDILGSAVLGASGGASGVHAHSFVIVRGAVVVAVGAFAVALRVPTLDLVWSCQVDPATCFGLHLAADDAYLISHGELEISRVTLDGSIVWQSSGADIFTGELVISEGQVRVDDFEGRRYVLDAETGKAQ